TTHSKRQERYTVTEDWPGLSTWDPRNWSKGGFRQEFETCALCLRTDPDTPTRQLGCVLGCVRWGHELLYDYWSVISHRVWGTDALYGPSGPMQRVLQQDLHTGLYKVDDSCNRFFNERPDVRLEP